MTPPLPTGYHARRPTPDDSEALAGLINLCGVHDTGVPLISAEQVRSLWQLPGSDPANDAWLVTTDDGALAGAALPFGMEPYDTIQALGVVHPQHEGRGLGTWLLERIEERAASWAALAPAGTTVALHMQSWSGNPRADTLLRRHGYDITRVFRLMQLDFEPGTPLPAANVPEGITLRTFVRGQDEQAVWHTQQESFEDHWNHHELPLDAWMQLHMLGPEAFDPSLWWLALEGDEVAGVALCDPAAPGQPEYGWIATLGVRRPWRGRGIASLLLATACAEYQRRGKRGVSLGVDADSPTGANRLYERAGMRVVTDSIVYGKTLRGGSEG